MTFYLTAARANLLDAVANRTFLEIAAIHSNSLENFVMSHSGNLSHAKYLIIDLKGLMDNNDEVVYSINQLRNLYDDLRLVILADCELIQENNIDLLRRIYKKGVYNIVTTASEDEIVYCILTGKTQEEAEEIFSAKSSTVRPSSMNMDDILKNAATAATTAATTGYAQRVVEEGFFKQNAKGILPPDSAGPKDVMSKEKLLANKDFRKYKDHISIGVCGAESHVGCTHNALLIAKFLKDIGFKVAYLEASGNQDIISLKQWQNPQTMHNEQKKLLQAMGINLFYTGFDMARMMAEKCDFHIYDLGAFAQKKELFLLRDIRILVGGSKPWEFEKVKKIADDLGAKNNVNYLLNFAIEADKPKLINHMESVKAFTFFTGYEPNPFASGANRDIFKRIFKEYIVQEEKPVMPQPQKKKGLFWK